MIKLAFMGLTLGLTACAARAPRAPAQEPSDAPGPAPAISLERTPCFGTCPVYTVSVSPAGQVTFQGRAHVRLLGTATGQIPPRRVDSLLVELEKAGYFRFASRYAASEAACGRYVTDLPVGDHQGQPQRADQAHRARSRMRCGARRARGVGEENR